MRIAGAAFAAAGSLRKFLFAGPGSSLHGRRGAAFDTRGTLRYRLVSARILGLLRLSGPKPAVLLHGHAETHKKMVAVPAQYDRGRQVNDGRKIFS